MVYVSQGWTRREYHHDHDGAFAFVSIFVELPVARKENGSFGQVPVFQANSVGAQSIAPPCTSTMHIKGAAHVVLPSLSVSLSACTLPLWLYYRHTVQSVWLWVAPLSKPCFVSKVGHYKQQTHNTTQYRTKDGSDILPCFPIVDAAPLLGWSGAASAAVAAAVDILYFGWRHWRLLLWRPCTGESGGRIRIPYCRRGIEGYGIIFSGASDRFDGSARFTVTCQVECDKRSDGNQKDCKHGDCADSETDLFESTTASVVASWGGTVRWFILGPRYDSGQY